MNMNKVDMTMLRTIRILVIIQLLTFTSCQDGFDDRDILRYQQASNDGQIQTITGYNVIQKDTSNQVTGLSNQQYPESDDYGRSSRRKIYRIKNPFQSQVNENERSQQHLDPQDSSTGASNQYAAVQYSLPPEEFLQQLRAENNFYQQQQVSTPAPNLGFTVTPLPQYYSTTASPSFDNNYLNSNQLQQQQPKISPAQSYSSSPSSYQYSTPNTLMDNIQSTLSPFTSYLSTPINFGQYLGTQSNSYVSSSSPVYLSSPPNSQQYVSSPFSVLNTASPDYSVNRIATTVSNNPLNYDGDSSKKLQVEHYGFAPNFRYPTNIQQQYQNEYASTTTTTTSSPYSIRESLLHGASSPGVNALSKSLQDMSFAPYQTYSYSNNQQDIRTEASSDSSNIDTHRIGNLASANNVFMNYAPPDSHMLNDLKIRTRDLENVTGQNYYSNGDYGWKMTNKKSQTNNEEYSKHLIPNLTSDNVAAVSQMNFHMDIGKSYNHDQAKSNLENYKSQEFAKAAAKAHDQLKQQQQYYNNYYGLNNEGNLFYSNDKQKNNYADNLNRHSNQFIYGNAQNDLITASPYLSSISRDKGDSKNKLPFDHEKALKNIVPIDVSNVVSNSGAVSNQATNTDYSNKFDTQYGKGPVEKNTRQYIRPLSDSIYTDKNYFSSYIKNKPDAYATPDSFKQIEASIYSKQPSQDQPYSQGSYPSQSQNFGYSSLFSNYHDNMQSSNNPQSGLPPNHNIPLDMESFLKLNDVPYKLSQSMSNDAAKMHKMNFDQGANIIPTPLPTRINQNVDSHQLDVATNLINKLFLNTQPLVNINRPEINNQPNVLPTINGFKVANPFNLDLKLVAEMLKGKSTDDDSYMMSMRPTSLRLDLTQLQHLLNRENSGNFATLNDGISGLNNPYIDIYNSGRSPYQGVKYSRSQEEEESIIPISDSTNNHPIGAVIEQDDSASEHDTNIASDLTAQGDDIMSTNYDDNRSKYLSGHRNVGDRHRSPSSLSGRHSSQRKYPINDVEEPYPLLKPPPPHTSIARSKHIKMEKSRRRRITKPKARRAIETEPLFDAEVKQKSFETPILLRPPPLGTESKSDTIENKNST